LKPNGSTVTRAAVALLTLTFAFALSACGGSDEDPAAVAEDFGNALINADGEAACETLSADLEAQAAESGGGECADAFTSDALTDEDREQGEQAVYETVEESDETATVEVTVPDEDPEQIEMIKEDGDWKIASI